MCTFSIITVTYNAEKFIRITLESVKQQLFKDYELIIIDGKSYDNTLKIVDEYKKYIRKIVCEKDKGIYDAMNKGIKIAEGDYCMFLNAGDALNMPDSLLLANRVLTDKKDVYFGDAIYDYGSKQVYYTPQLSKLPYRFCHQSMFFKTDLIKREIYDVSYKLSGDSELIYRLVEKGFTFGRIKIPVVKELARGGATEKYLYQSAKELFSRPYLRKNLNLAYIAYRLFKIRIYCIFKIILNVL